jgi:putative ABC transport system permease protein
MKKHPTPTGRSPLSNSSNPAKPERRLPPRWADYLLAWFVAPHLLEYVQGDLHEAFHKRVAQAGLIRARRDYVWAVLQCLTPFFAKRLRDECSHHPYNEYPTPLFTDMLRNYLKIAWRNLVRNKAYTSIT